MSDYSQCADCGRIGLRGRINHSADCGHNKRADALQAPLADHGISPAQLREKVEALEKRCDVLDAQLSAALVSISALNQGLLRIEELEKWSHSHTAIGHVDLTVHKTLKEPFDNARAVKEWEERNWAPKDDKP